MRGGCFASWHTHVWRDVQVGDEEASYLQLALRCVLGQHEGEGARGGGGEGAGGASEAHAQISLATADAPLPLHLACVRACMRLARGCAQCTRASHHGAAWAHGHLPACSNAREIMEERIVQYPNDEVALVLYNTVRYSCCTRGPGMPISIHVCRAACRGRAR